MRPMTFFNKMGGMSRQINETIEKAVTGRIDEHRMLQVVWPRGATTQYATPQSTSKVQVFESLGARLKNEMDQQKQKRSI